MKRLKYLKLLYQFPIYILYVIFTAQKRDEYLAGVNRGMHVESSRDDSYFIPGSATVYTFNPGKKPERKYLTWKEFWQQRGYYK